MAKPIMIQGTMSGVGKSLIAAGLCRIFKQDGYLPAPFQSQNMVKHSYITSEGLEMGRNQAMQAYAAGVEPVAAMNPVLLKPTSETGAQVIVNGLTYGNMPAKQYFSYKENLVPEIQKAYQKLDAAYDILVIEGAGSPAEINLKQKDIVNMGLAEMVNAPVLLVADVDRGGVFAQLLGTLMLLEQPERARVKGMIINRFRGDKCILEPGIQILQQRSGRQVVGVTPYLQFDMEEKDRVEECSVFRQCQDKQAVVTIAVIRLPKISNITDFRILEKLHTIHLRYVSYAEDLGMPDMVVLPGSKNTMGDLKWLRESGLEEAILKCHAHGVVIMGICGGYQMLGQSLSDPMFTEEGGRARGIGLLPVETVFDNTKTCTRVRGTFAKLHGPLSPLSGMILEGFETHMGHTTPVSGLTWCRHDLAAENRFAQINLEQTFRQKMDGWQMDQVYGTYVHGVFDGPGIAETLACALAAKKGIQIEPASVKKRREYRQKQFDRLADTLREHLNMRAIYQMLELK